jgi:hypothetical protein
MQGRKAKAEAERPRGGRGRHFVGHNAGMLLRVVCGLNEGWRCYCPR